MTGRRIGRTLATHFPTLNALPAATLDDLTEGDGIGRDKARAIHAGLRDNREIPDRLVAAAITTHVEQTPASSAPLNGKDRGGHRRPANHEPQPSPRRRQAR